MKYILMFLIAIFISNAPVSAKSLEDVVEANRDVNFNCKYEISRMYGDNSMSDEETKEHFRNIFGFKAIEFKLMYRNNAIPTNGKIFGLNFYFTTGALPFEVLYYNSPETRYEKSTARYLNDWGLHSPQNYYFSVNQQNFLENLINEFKTTGICPSNIFIQGKELNYHVALDQSGDDSYTIYQLGIVNSQGSTNPGEQGNDCRHQNATVCETITLEDNKYTAELGWYNANGTDKKYLLVSLSEDENGYVSDEIIGDDYAGLFVNFDDNHFYITNEAINELYPTTNEILSDIRVVKQFGDGQMAKAYYYISGPNTYDPNAGFDVTNPNPPGGFPEPPIINECQDILGNPATEGSPAFYLSKIFSVLRYVAIVILIVMTILDFVGAVASQDNDVIKKAVNKLIKRAILCVVIFLLPTLIEFILKFIHNRAVTTCGIGA